MSGNWFTCKIAGRENGAVYKEDEFSSVEQEILELLERASDRTSTKSLRSVDLQLIFKMLRYAALALPLLAMGGHATPLVSSRLVHRMKYLVNRM